MMKKQKERARKNWKGTGDQEDQKNWFKITENLSSTEFLGYEQTESESEITSIVKSDSKTDQLKKVKMELSF